MRRGKVLRALVGAGLALGLTAPPASAQSTFNTALSQPEANKLIYQTCDLERGHAMTAAATLGWDWNDVLAKANQVLLANMDTAVLNRMLDKSGSTGGSRADRDIGEFQYCLILNKINLAEAHEKRAKR